MRLTGLAATRGVAAHLVGGTVRDLLLGRTPADLDVVVAGQAEALAADLAAATGGAVVPLDDAPPTVRVVLPTGADGSAGRVVDLAAYRGPSLMADLALRDFTVNALAAPLAAVAAGERAQIVDPGGGLRDLERRRLRMTGERAFDDDPLRALRAFRLAAALGFDIDPATARAAAARAGSLGRVAAERRAAEVFRLLAEPRAGAHLLRLARANLLLPTLGLSRPLRTDWRPALGRLDEWLAVPTAWPASAVPDLDRPLAADRPRAALLRFAQAAGGEAPAAAAALRLSAREVAFVRALEAGRAAIAGAADAEAEEPGWLVRRLVRPLGADAEAALLHAAASLPQRGRGRALRALRALTGRVRPRLAQPRPLSGDDLMRECGVAAGPAVGRLLEWLDEARAGGEVSDRASALAFARAHAARACRDGTLPV
jgi:tRNA nucleotidyltransferase/poly(A) polymerase